jgi:hypothetical protein
VVGAFRVIGTAGAGAWDTIKIGAGAPALSCVARRREGDRGPDRGFEELVASSRPKPQAPDWVKKLAKRRHRGPGRLDAAAQGMAEWGVKAITGWGSSAVQFNTWLDGWLQPHQGEAEGGRREAKQAAAEIAALTKFDNKALARRHLGRGQRPHPARVRRPAVGADARRAEEGRRPPAEHRGGGEGRPEGRARLAAGGDLTGRLHSGMKVTKVMAEVAGAGGVHRREGHRTLKRKWGSRPPTTWSPRAAGDRRRRAGGPVVPRSTPRTRQLAVGRVPEDLRRPGRVGRGSGRSARSTAAPRSRPAGDGSGEGAEGRRHHAVPATVERHPGRPAAAHHLRLPQGGDRAAGVPTPSPATRW